MTEPSKIAMYKYSEVSLMVSEKSNTTERHVYKLLEFIGDIGGFNDALVLVLEFFMAFYSPPFFAASLVKSLFLVDRFLPSTDPNFFNRLYVSANYRRAKAKTDKLDKLRKHLIAKLERPNVT